VGSFLAEVANLDRIVNVTGLSLKDLEDGTKAQTVEAEFQATAYTLNPITETPATGKPEATKPTDAKAADTKGKPAGKAELPGGKRREG
ncbi:MAG TPA: type 4a pilus biogenesis protein PilO, partial [Dongiaceae bacterium]|nr:type 4a pilus biogenesis protein PilO [Dongiaceae bacterium]